ncbi:hypothetical protein BC939DRAFT_311020 [Gamsiella multidivaricata]|uniref:uncharacterized protein n=1 Tax=Gamsiella multidivaricata TaxID=101098 RepID=UPI0022204B5D|nr:uncharacterized protein BC939DRAFT_311020 [Gamsiella multidivaricata]KAI7817991.1 hypothetical protein BC939DRAFT_311020 [Gamsiella multidivaricata]
MPLTLLFLSLLLELGAESGANNTLSKIVERRAPVPVLLSIAEWNLVRVCRSSMGLQQRRTGWNKYYLLTASLCIVDSQAGTSNKDKIPGHSSHFVFLRRVLRPSICSLSFLWLSGCVVRSIIDPRFHLQAF